MGIGLRTYSSVAVAALQLPPEGAKLIRKIAQEEGSNVDLDSVEEFKMAAIVLRGMNRENQTTPQTKGLLVKEGNELYEYKLTYRYEKAKPPYDDSGKPDIRKEALLVRRNAKTNQKETIPVDMDWEKCASLPLMDILQVASNGQETYLLLKDYNSDPTVEIAKIVQGEKGKKVVRFLSEKLSTANHLDTDATHVGLSVDGADVVVTSVFNSSNEVRQTKLNTMEAQPQVCAGQI